MKKMLFVAIATLVSLTASAQMNGYDPFFRIGLKAGANLSNIRGNDLSLGPNGSAFNFKDNSDRVVGFAGGLFMRFGRDFYVQPEFLFSQKGGSFSVYRDGVTNEMGQLDMRFTNFDIPVLLGGRFGKVFRINAGPIASLQLSNSGKISDSFNEYTDQEVEAVYDNKVVFGYQMGVGVDLGRFSIDLRYEGNVNDVVNINYNNQTTAAQFGKKNNLIQATLGVALN